MIIKSKKYSKSKKIIYGGKIFKININACNFNTNTSEGSSDNCGLNALEVLGVINEESNHYLTPRCENPYYSTNPSKCFNYDNSEGMSLYSILDIMKARGHDTSNIVKRTFNCLDNYDCLNCLHKYYETISSELKEEEGIFVFIKYRSYGHYVVLAKLQDSPHIIDKQNDSSPITPLTEYFDYYLNEVETIYISVLEDHNDPFFSSLNFDCNSNRIEITDIENNPISRTLSQKAINKINLSHDE